MVAPLVAALAAAWVALLVLAPQLPVQLAGVVYVFGSVICHQIAERSFHVDGAQLPVCARCFGIYLGAALGACAARPLVARSPRAVVVASGAPTLLTIGLEWTGLHSANVTRAAAGLICGAAVAAFVLHYGECERTRRSEISQPAPHI